MLENINVYSEKNANLETKEIASLSKEERMKYILVLANRSMDEHKSLYEKLAQ